MRNYHIALHDTTRDDLDKLIEVLEENGERIFRHSSIYRVQNYPMGFLLSFGIASMEWSVTVASTKIGNIISTDDFIKKFNLQRLQRIYDERVY